MTSKTLNDMSMDDELYRAADIARHMGISVPTVWKWARLGKLPSPIKISHKVTVWKKSELMPAIERMLAH